MRVYLSSKNLSSSHWCRSILIAVELSIASYSANLQIFHIALFFLRTEQSHEEGSRHT